MNKAAQRVLDHFDLEQLDTQTYATKHANEGHPQVFGGQLMGQAVTAARHNVPEPMTLASFQSNFIAPGRVEHKIHYRVETLRHTRRSSLLQVEARQVDQLCFRAAVLFQAVGGDLAYQKPAPSVPAPQDCADFPAMVAAYQRHFPNHLGDGFTTDALPPQPLEMRFANVDEFLSPSADQLEQALWVRLDAAMDDDPERHKCVLAYASDQTISHIVAQSQGFGGLKPGFKVLSVDHALWFHNTFRIDEWVLLARQCPAISAGRAFVTGSVFDANGRLVASLTQQALARLSP